MGTARIDAKIAAVRQRQAEQDGRNRPRPPAVPRWWESTGAERQRVRDGAAHPRCTGAR